MQIIYSIFGYAFIGLVILGLIGLILDGLGYLENRKQDKKETADITITITLEKEDAEKS